MNLKKIIYLKVQVDCKRLTEDEGEIKKKQQQ